MFSQGKGRHFRPGQHLQLLEYLAKICGLNSNESIDEEVRLSKILEKQQNYALTQQIRDAVSPPIASEENRKQNQLTSSNNIYDQIQNLKSVLNNNNTSFEGMYAVYCSYLQILLFFFFKYQSKKSVN